MYRIVRLCLANACCMAVWAATDVGPTFHIRLDVPLTSFDSPAGTEFTATVIAPLEVGGESILPQGTLILGTVIRASAVGYGFVHERAMLHLSFDEYQLADGERYPFEARLEFIENAREQVDSRGRIKGVLAASSPQGLLRGIWYRPTESFIHRSAIGLTGLGGALWSRYSLGPAGAAGMIAARYLAFPLPEPEIQLPPGTEMRLIATNIPDDAPRTPVPPDPGVEEDLAIWLRTHPRVVMKPDGTHAADVINLAFLGDLEELQNAFAAAGWMAAEPLTLRSFSTAYRAYNSMSGYSTAPVSMLLYQREEPVIVFQKSFNTIAKRHHIRLWRAGTFEGKDVWFGAATHDAGIGFQWSSMTITHKIDPQTDRERRKVVMDLSFAVCSQRISFLDRLPGAKPARSTWIQTDGRLAVIWLQPCTGSTLDTYSPQDDSPLPPPGSRGKRIIRRFVLETRQYFLRDNMYYWAYRATNSARKSIWRGARPSE